MQKDIIPAFKNGSQSPYLLLENVSMDYCSDEKLSAKKLSSNSVISVHPHLLCSGNSRKRVMKTEEITSMCVSPGLGTASLFKK
jgi:hypothetical protein